MSKFSHSQESSEPGYYSVLLESPASSYAQLVATSTHTGTHNYTFNVDEEEID